MSARPAGRVSRAAAAAIVVTALLSACASAASVSSDEFYSIGMAYFEMGKYADAERWLDRARAVDKTRAASEYTLGRIAFETGRYDEAARRFERILARDPVNVMALKAAAFARLKNGELDKAGALYDRVLALVPDSADDGYNHALVLYALGKYGDAEALLRGFETALEESDDALLLLARAQRAQDKVEAADSYDKWLAVAAKKDPQVNHEYAGVLEKAGLYARALEQYRAARDALTGDDGPLKKSAAAFDAARLLLVADPENPEGLTELDNAVTKLGFADTDALEALAADDRITAAARDAIPALIARARNPAGAAEPVTGDPVPALPASTESFLTLVNAGDLAGMYLWVTVEIAGGEAADGTTAAAKTLRGLAGLTGVRADPVWGLVKVAEDGTARIPLYLVSETVDGASYRLDTVESFAGGDAAGDTATGAEGNAGTATLWGVADDDGQIRRSEERADSARKKAAVDFVDGSVVVDWTAAAVDTGI